ncbi:cyclin-L1 [Lingula anatina]|uniref:Cyclin-L1 n=1 Tax=Lingula anatina TaxID=7574 RepID=A0A1S3JMH6_LINAN|nr:cyclin-L1 [Lingula anatina]|eukprot:XP_013411114.1 cyclin-L1 [Lingula anatina]
MAEVKEETSVNQEYGRVILTLDNVLIPPEKLSPTPSMSDGLDHEAETDLRILGCELIQTAGILLKLPQVAMATGQLLFQRFYYSKSFIKHSMETTAMACMHLASKIEEDPRRIRDVVNVFHHIKQVRNGKIIKPLIIDEGYVSIKNQVIKAERRVLKELGFCVHVKHPHKIIVMYLRVLKSERHQRLVQTAWNYMNDSFRTDVFVRYYPETIACACIYLAARQLRIPMPSSPRPWFELFGVEEEDIRAICMTLLKLYARPKPNAEKLDALVKQCHQIINDKKKTLKDLGISAGNTPNSTSRPSSPKNVSPSPHTLVAKVKQEEDRSDRSGSLKDYNHVDRKKKRGHTRSRSRSSSVPRSYKNRNTSSRSHSKSPSPKKKRHSPPRKYKKDKAYDHYDPKDKHRNVHKRRRSRSLSPRARSRSRSYSRSPDRKHSKKNLKEKERYRSRSRSKDRHRSKKHGGSANGHHKSSEKYKAYDKHRYDDRYRR